MKIIGGIFLALIALFTGGCSIFFALNDIAGQGLGVAVIWGPGLVIGGLSGWGAVKLLSGKSANAGANPASKPGTPPDLPKSDNW